MKIIEAMKKVKANKEKITDLQNKIGQTCANLSFETPMYGSETGTKIKEWLQSCQDLSQDNIKLLVAIQKTNMQTQVTIDISEKTVTKSIAEWVWRRREYSKLDLLTFSKLTDRGLKEGAANTSTGVPVQITLVRHYDPQQRDTAMAMYQQEPHLIDAALEVVNAVTDLAA
jgi:hypothetical protein